MMDEAERSRRSVELHTDVAAGKPCGSVRTPPVFENNSSNSCNDLDKPKFPRKGVACSLLPRAGRRSSGCWVTSSAV